MMAARAISHGDINHQTALGTDAKSVTKPVGTVTLPPLFDLISIPIWFKISTSISLLV